MKNTRKLSLASLFGLIFIIPFVISSCSKDDDKKNEPKEEPLTAKIVPQNQTVAPLTKVTLDGSSSTGPKGFKYKWSVVSSPGNVRLSNESSAKASFTPEKNGIYNFLLRITSGSKISESRATVTVSGLIPLNEKSFTTNTLTLKDISISEADYIINDDFTIPKGKTIIIPSDKTIRIKVASGKGVVVNGNFNVLGQLFIEESVNSWKGILVNGGRLSIHSQFTINKAGGSAFSGHEAAALTFAENGGLSISDGGSIKINNTISDLGMVLTPKVSNAWSMGRSNASIDSKIPVKAPISYLPKLKISQLGGNEYIHLTTPGAGTTVAPHTGHFIFSNQKYYIDGDFTSGRNIDINSATIYMKAGAGIVCSGTFNIVSSTIKGLKDANWKGIAAQNTITISRSKIIGAGSDVHNTGSFFTTEKAAIHSAVSGLPVTVRDSEITKSGGYGIYIVNRGSNNSVSGTKFSNIAKNDISLPYSGVGSAIRDGNKNTWSSSTPVEVRTSNGSIGQPWVSLGAGKAYLVKDKININAGVFTLKPGVHIKFKLGTSLTLSSRIVAKGTADKPIILEGESNIKGAWHGIMLRGQYQMEYCTIKNGGQAPVSVNPTLANIVFGSGSEFMPPPQTLYSFKNNTISGSRGYGAFIELRMYNPFVGNSTNKFIGNRLGNIKK